MEHVENINDWTVLTPVSRIDSFNKQSFEDEINEVILKGRKQLAIDFSNLQFLSYPSIKFLSSKAQALKEEGGSLAICSPSEKLKKQIAVYATLKDMHIFRSKKEL